MNNLIKTLRILSVFLYYSSNKLNESFVTTEHSFFFSSLLCDERQLKKNLVRNPNYCNLDIIVNMHFAFFFFNKKIIKKDNTTNKRNVCNTRRKQNRFKKCSFTSPFYFDTLTRSPCKKEG